MIVKETSQSTLHQCFEKKFNSDESNRKPELFQVISFGIASCYRHYVRAE